MAERIIIISMSTMVTKHVQPEENGARCWTGIYFGRREPQTQRRQYLDVRPHAAENDDHQSHFVAATPVGSHGRFKKEELHEAGDADLVSGQACNNVKVRKGGKMRDQVQDHIQARRGRPGIFSVADLDFRT
jgi:hypothetical protein